ncbi:MAG: molybdopterin-dependent oxidoreductase [Candidatus Marinimicrobia bacterium]|jgi:putative selenate reductase molybdopterin-binding subunit|nr:molybdopterin-dependent oxidoreductase [Candidatus Neomarinimicrobiota bacterium]MBT3632162.1 molybdopterin-dependent oxidoreductase [Candidatus Neomarinimicrobiota bacterium]MBT3824317.1 molybdopterin-dependent oxidoreductase [Candidatus Neomarinimicrobiota bacterium]MBT4130030.1 molybdopterin-dependent oxidoreductase [Candidatus Neomarinimicrobiota bacterium]MBT4295017.1 molybdopterin-dependent oxidoreductase [Candidatus Neomarinimicrobiota bacterium]
MKVIGKDTQRVDGQALVRGKPVFADDMQLKDVLYVKILHSPIAHANILSIDVSKAEALEGVVAVFTHKDFKPHYYTTAGQGYPEPGPRDMRILDETVRFVGDRVAFVAAESITIAEQAIGLIDVEYEELPCIFDSQQSMTAGFAIHPSEGTSGIHDVEKNIAAHLDAKIGDVEAALAGSAHTFEGSYSTPFVQMAHIEPHISLSWLDDNNRLVIRTSTQVPHHVRRIVAEVLDIPVGRIRVIKPRIGGGFGGKQEILNEEVVGAVTLKTGRPARIEYTRAEELFAARVRHPELLTIQLGFDESHLLTAIDINILEDCGAYGPHALTVMSVTSQKALSMYKAPNIRVNGDGVYTNLPIGGAYRGYGAPQAFFPLESLMDEAAMEMGIDPIDLRLKNVFEVGDDVPIAKILGEGREGFPMVLYSTEIAACLNEGRALSNWDALRSAEQSGRFRRGVGVAVAGQGSGIPGIDMGAAFIKMNEDASFNLQIGATDLGTGSDTALAQIAAEVLNVSVDKIIVYSSDTDMTPFDTGAYASSTTYISGTAVKKAAEACKAMILEQGRKLLQIDNAEIIDTRVVGSDGQTISFSDICIKSFYTEEQTQIMGSASHLSYDSPPPFNATFAEVEVDTLTGTVRVIKIVSVTDAGQIINPKMAEGQVEGGIPQALGMALSEFMPFDDKGRFTNLDFNSYHIYTSNDMPEMVVRFADSHEPTGPYGAKAVAEIPINAPAPAVANAVYNAVGVRIKHLPIKPEQILAGMNGK